MLTFLKTHAAAFGPDEIVILSAAFQNAWGAVLASGAQLGGNAEVVREMLAKHIIEGAQRGELNQIRLRDDALSHVVTVMNLRPLLGIGIKCAEESWHG